MVGKHAQKKRGKLSKIRFSEAEDGAEDEPENEELSGSVKEDGPAAKRETDDFNLDEVLKLGGTQSDFVLLSTVDESKQLTDGGKKDAIDDLEEGELEKFITKLGIRNYSNLQIIPDEETDIKEKQSDKPNITLQKGKQKEKQKTSQKTAAKSSGETSTAVKESTKASAKKAKVNVFEFIERNVLLIKPGGKWFDSEYTSEFTSVKQDKELVAKYKILAQRLLDNEVQIYRTKKNLQKGANSTWMKTVVSAGVLADRMAAMTVLIQDSAVHSLEHIENLISMMKKKGRRMGLMALDTLRELLLSDLLPENRKLHSFAERSFEDLEEKASGNKDARDRRLILWAFEHGLKLLVAEFIIALESISHDPVFTTKTKALSTALELLSSRPEQEKALLTQTVNKLGDPEYKLAAKASHALETLLFRHPNMKGVVCGEVERLLFRSNIAEKAQYYALCFLNQVILNREDANLAARLIGIYFSFFGLCVKRRQVQSKMLSALLSGVNRAYPYAPEGDAAVKSHMDTLFSLVHTVKFNLAIQALMLLYQVMESQQSLSDRYYCALYRKLLDPGLSSCHQSMFLNLLYNSVKADTVIRRVKAFVKRLMQVSTEQSSNFVCGALILLSEVLKSKPALSSLMQNSLDADEEMFRDQPEEEEDEIENGKEEIKQENEDTDRPQPERPSASWVHHYNLEGGTSCASYSPLHRNPLFCGADHSSLWELQQLSKHFHPSVSLFAKTILKGESITYSGDPLQDFTLIRFLDRFVFRNPKQTKGKQNTGTVVLQRKKNKMVASLPVNCEEFVSQDETQIPVDQIFFHRFFRKRREVQQKRKPRTDEDTESIEDVDDDEFEKILDSCEGDPYYAQLKEQDLDFAGSMNRTKTKAKADADSDSDSDMESDLDDEEVELSLDEEDFGEEFEEKGGAFMEPHDNDEDDEEIPELDEDEEFDELEEEMDFQPQKKPNKRKQELSADSGPKKKKGKHKSKVLTSGEEFGSLLDENGSSKFDNIGLNAMRNTDKAGVKQLKWETQRDDWIHNRDAKTLRRKKSLFNKKKTFFTGNRKVLTGKRKNSAKRRK